MNLPKRVQADLDAANALEARIQAERAEPAANTAQRVEDLVHASAPAAPEPQIPPVVAPPAAPPEPAKPDFEHKFNVLQGMYKADVTRVKDQLKELGTEIERLKQAPAAPAAAPQPNEKDIETFGADLIEMVKRYAEGQQAQVNARLDALEQKVSGVASAAVRSAKQVFFDKLRQLVPDMEAINADERWLVWLGELDAAFGLPRQAALDDAQEKLDAPRVAGMFAAFRKALPVPPPPPSLEDQIAPHTAGTPLPVPDAPKQLIGTKAIDAFYNDVGRGRYVGREAEMTRIEANINLAIAEGRVVQS
jgi:hypothetical protein